MPNYLSINIILKSLDSFFILRQHSKMFHCKCCKAVFPPKREGETRWVMMWRSGGEKVRDEVFGWGDERYRVSPLVQARWNFHSTSWFGFISISESQHVLYAEPCGCAITKAERLNWDTVPLHIKLKQQDFSLQAGQEKFSLTKEGHCNILLVYTAS